MCSPRTLNAVVCKALAASAVIWLAPCTQADFGSSLWFAVLSVPRLDDSFLRLVWIADCAWTLILQGLIAAGLYLLFRRLHRFFWLPIAAVLVWLSAGYPLSIGAVWLDARAVPFLYRGQDPAPLDAREVCRVQHAHLLAPAKSHYEFLERSERAWLLAHDAWEPALLTPEACAQLKYTAEETGKADLKEIFKPEPQFDIRFPHAGFRNALFERALPSYNNRTWSGEHGFQFTPAGLMLQRQFAPGGCVIFGFNPPRHTEVRAESLKGCPSLSGDSGSLARLGDATYSEDDRRILVTPEQATGQRAIDISKIGQGFVVLESFSVKRHAVLLRRQVSAILRARAPDLEARSFTYEFAELSAKGEILWSLPRTGDADSAQLAFDSGNWVWWQSDPDGSPGCCRVEWEVAGISGSHRVTRGRTIVSVSLAPNGKWIALSVSDRHRTGSIPDSVYVFSTFDRHEVFRRFLPPLAQSRVQFLGTDLLAYTDFDGSDGFVRVILIKEM